jgi:hypothetical protein
MVDDYCTMMSSGVRVRVRVRLRVWQHPLVSD